MTEPRARLAIAIVVLAGFLCACGVSTQSQPDTIAPADVPFGLAERASKSGTTTSLPGRHSWDLYFVVDDSLVRVTHSSEAKPSPAEVLRQLVDGPEDVEREQGLRSVLPPAVAVRRVVVDDGLATISLDGSTASLITSDEQRLAIAQIVYTVTSLPHVDRVRFVVDGRPSEVPLGDGRLSDRPVARADYPDVSPH